MFTSRVEIAFVGCGDLFEKSVVPRLLRRDGRERFRVVAVCDVDESRRERFANLLGCPGFGDYGAMLGVRGLEAVGILTPAELHVPQAMEALRLGVDVYLQKPAATSGGELDELLLAVGASGRRVVCAPLMPHYPTIRRIGESLRAGLLGPVFYAIAPCMGWGGRSLDAMPTDPAWRFQSGNGPLRDHGIYSLVTLQWLFGVPRRVAAMAGVRVPARGWRGTTFEVTEPDNVAVILSYDGGVLVHLHEAWAGEAAGSASLRIVGLEGTIQTFGGIWDVNPQGFDHFSAHGELVSRVDLRDDPAADGYWDGIYNPHVWADLIHLADCIREEKAPVVTLEETRAVYRTIDGIVEAVRTGRTVEL